MAGSDDSTWRDRARGEVPLAAALPWSSLVSEHDVLTRGGDLLRTWRLEGLPFEAAEPGAIAAHHEAKCHWLASLAGGQFVVWAHRIQRFVHERLDPVCGGYPAEFDEAYARRQQAQPFLANELYLTLQHRPMRLLRRGLLGVQPRSRDQIASELAQAQREMEERSETLERMLRDLSPQRLGVREEAGTRLSEVAGFLSFLCNGRWSPVRHDGGPLYRRVPATRVSAQAGLVELAAPGRRRYAAMLDIKEYADGVEPGSLDALLYEPVEYIETQCWASMPRREALSALRRQQKQLHAAEDVVLTQIEAMDDAIDAVGDGRLGMGEYHYGLAVFGDSPEAAERHAARAVGAVAELTGIQLAQVDLLADRAWFAQWPGNLRQRPRHAVISSRAFAALAADHGFYRGKREGNPWGPPALLVRSRSGQPVCLNLHLTAPAENAEGAKAAGGTLITGINGAGKTTLEAALLMQSRRWSPAPRIVALDKDRGLEIAIRALGGTYLQLQLGHPTGINPFQRDPTPARLRFWSELVLACVSDPAQPVQPAEVLAVEQAVAAMATMPAPLRSMSAVRQNLPALPGSLELRLARWCHGGPLGWVFDEAYDALPQDPQVFGADYTQVLPRPEIRTPLVMALLQYVEDLIDGRRLMVVIAEAWKALGDPRLAAFAHDKSRTIRKQNGLVIFDTQEPGDVHNAMVGDTIASQLATSICFPDDRTPPEAYVRGLGLTEAEARTVRELRRDGSRCFLLKQGVQSAVCEFDLTGMDEHILVLSGSTDHVLLLDEIRAEVGDDPAAWLPVLQARALGRKVNAQPLRRVA